MPRSDVVVLDILDDEARPTVETVATVVISALVVIVSFALGTSAVTHLGGFLIGLASTMLYLPHCVNESIEAASPYFALLILLIFFFITPIAFSATVGDPICLLGP